MCLCGDMIVCKSSAHDATLKVEVIQTSSISCVLRRQNVASPPELFRKLGSGQATREKLSLQHVPAICSLALGNLNLIVCGYV